MEKKTYEKPTIKVATLEPLQILTASGGDSVESQQIRSVSGFSLDELEDTESESTDRNVVHIQ